MNTLYNDYLTALNYPGSPTLFLDLSALEKNINWVKQNSGNKKIRIATKSIRSKEVLKKILASGSVFQGLMTYDLREALWLRSEGFQDILMGYPTVDTKALKDLATDPQGIILMTDLPEHIELIQSEASKTGKTIKICIDIDLSMDLPGVRFGVFRSRITSIEKLKKFVEVLKNCPNVELTGLMGYEAQIAGVMDKHSPLIQLLKKVSIKKLKARRKEMIDYLHSQDIKLSLVNGGGTGSLLSTIEESHVTEVTVGSGFFSPVLFDHYKDFKLTPALLFTLPIVRNPEPGIFTCLGGGYIASGAIEKIKQPTPFLPYGLELLKHEGAGEVQTPMKYIGEQELKIGSSVIMRHAKSGEVCERFERIEIIEKGLSRGSFLTYRGEGKTFV